MPNVDATNDTEIDPDRLIELMWRAWLALLDRYDGIGSAATDPMERLQVQYDLFARGLVMCAIPALTHDALGRKAIVAAWLRDHAGETWTVMMVEIAIMADTDALQPAHHILA